MAPPQRTYSSTEECMPWRVFQRRNRRQACSLLGLLVLSIVLLFVGVIVLHKSQAPYAPDAQGHPSAEDVAALNSAILKWGNATDASVLSRRGWADAVSGWSPASISVQTTTDDGSYNAPPSYSSAADDRPFATNTTLFDMNLRGGGGVTLNFSSYSLMPPPGARAPLPIPTTAASPPVTLIANITMGTGNNSDSSGPAANAFFTYQLVLPLRQQQSDELPCAARTGCSAYTQQDKCARIYGDDATYQGSGCSYATDYYCGACKYYSFLSSVCVVFDVTKNFSRRSAAEASSRGYTYTLPAGFGACPVVGGRQQTPLSTRTTDALAYSRQLGRDSAPSNTAFAMQMRRSDDPFVALLAITKGTGQLAQIYPSQYNAEAEWEEEHRRLTVFAYGLLAAGVLAGLLSVGLAATVCISNEAAEHRLDEEDGTAATQLLNARRQEEATVDQPMSSVRGRASGRGGAATATQTQTTSASGPSYGGTANTSGVADGPVVGLVVATNEMLNQESDEEQVPSFVRPRGGAAGTNVGDRAYLPPSSQPEGAVKPPATGSEAQSRPSKARKGSASSDEDRPYQYRRK